MRIIHELDHALLNSLCVCITLVLVVPRHGVMVEKNVYCAENERYHYLPASAWRIGCADNERYHSLPASA